uniref:GST N-terminal domain-containing protein n=1 Tax=Romanomermis culicivorax TaxID=13658 RepID=A0A915I0F3_ROMCU
ADSTKNVDKKGGVQNTPDSQADQNQNQHQISSPNIQPATSSNESAKSVIYEAIVDGGAAQVANGALARPPSDPKIVEQTYASLILNNLQSLSHEIEFDRQMMTTMGQDQQQQKHKVSYQDDPKVNFEPPVKNVADNEIISSRENLHQMDNLDEIQQIMDRKPIVASNLGNDQAVQLIYFDKQRLTAEPARLIMQYANVRYGEQFVPINEWHSYQPGTPMGTLPVLRLAEGDLCQPMAIARYLASTHGLLGADDWEAANVDMLIHGFLDLLDNLKPVYSEPDDGIRIMESSGDHKKCFVVCLSLMDELLNLLSLARRICHLKTFQMVRSPQPALSTTTTTTKKVRLEIDRYTCPANFTMCRNLYCVSLKFRCDGFDDCGDGTDEEKCDAKERISRTCARNKFKCSLGPCISRLSLCDGVTGHYTRPLGRNGMECNRRNVTERKGKFFLHSVRLEDCPQGEDEIGCSMKPKQSYCQKGYFQCLDVDGCIPGDWVCDGEADCNDASDERNCQRPHQRSADSWSNILSQSQGASNFLSRRTLTTSQPCNKFSFICGSGDCITESRVCDGRRDCRDGSDEGNFCKECLIQNGGCQEFCQPKPEGAQCSCRVGYRLMSDRKSCRDPRACSDGDKVCDHYCTMIGDSRLCYCSFGYETFGQDGTRCKLIISEGYLIFAAGPEIRTIELNEDHRHNLYGLMFRDKTDSRVGSLSYNNRKHLVYFASDNKIQYINEKSRATCVLGGFQRGIDLAIDWVTENIYYVENSPAMLGVCRWDGRYCHEFYYNQLTDVRGIALHPRRGLMFWIDHAKTMRIERADMDGSRRRVVVDHKLEEPVALTIDYVHERIYWVDAKLSMIESCDLDGSYRALVLSSATKHPVDLFVFDSKIYWADSYASGIYSTTTRDPNANVTLVHSSPFKPNSLTVNHTAYHNLSLSNPCELITCSYICTIHSTEDGGIVAKCLCPKSYVAHPDKPTECYPTNTLSSVKPSDC